MAAVSVVVLTMGDRPNELAEAIGSARRQSATDVQIVLVVNGGDPDTSAADVVVRPGTNLGIPGGRNAGAAAASHGLLCFLDDDAVFADDDVLAATAPRFARTPRLGVVGFGIVDETGASAQRHQPRLGRSARGGPATSFPGGASVVRSEAFDAVGGLCEPFHYGLEETDLSWRLLDAGWTIEFAPELRLRHPRSDPHRHADYLRHTGRNRVYLAHRSLPLPLAVLYVLDWIAVTLLRNLRHPRAVGAYLAGTGEGLRTRIGPRRPIRWSTVWTLTRLGRPPII